MGPKSTPTKTHVTAFVAPQFCAISSDAIPQTIQTTT